MTAQDKVWDCFPRSEAREEPPIFEHGADFPIEGGFWVIVSGPEFDADELGRGRTENEAWSDAAGLLGNQAA
jgi:hypothetical protein